MAEIVIPENFKSIIVDFTNDLTITFPEYSYLWDRWRTEDETVYKELFEHCLTSFPERFFDILYQNVEIFEPNNETNTMFLPSIDFKLLYNCQGVSENTKKTIWKYLQLLLFTVVGSVKDKSIFGDTANMFDGIDENDLQEKLKDTMEGITDFFEKMGVDLDESSENKENDSEEQKHEFKFDPKEGMPNMADLHEHLRGLFDGKIGTLAKELAEEISGEFSNIIGEDFAADGENAAHTTQDVLKKMMKNPKKMMDLVKTVGDKLKHKMDSGEISKDEIMKEATDILAKMKDMGGGNDLNEMLKKFAGGMGGMGGMGKNMRINTAALNQMTRKEEMKQRMRSKIEAKRQQMQMSENAGNVVIEPGSAPNNYVFRMPGEGEQQKSTVPLTDDELIAAFSSSETKPDGNIQTSNKKKKNGKKGKK